MTQLIPATTDDFRSQIDAVVDDLERNHPGERVEFTMTFIDAGTVEFECFVTNQSAQRKRVAAGLRPETRESLYRRRSELSTEDDQGWRSLTLTSQGGQLQSATLRY